MSIILSVRYSPLLYLFRITLKEEVGMEMWQTMEIQRQEV